MKVLHISLTDSKGGAAIAMQRLHHALLATGVESKILTMSKKTDDEHVLFLPDLYSSWDKLQWWVAKLRHRVSHRKYESYLFSVLQKLEYDVIHLHWIVDDYGDMLSYNDLYNIGKPIIISLHDCVSFTGGCHSFNNCHGYIKGCKDCILENYSSTASIVFRKKIDSLAIVKPYFVAPSRWMLGVARNAPLLREREIVKIPWGIDINVFTPIDKREAREMFNWNMSDIVLLAGAVNVSDPQKGLNDLVVCARMLKQIFPSKCVRIVCFGQNNANIEGIEDLGPIFEEKKLVMVYSAADVMLVPSRQESFGLTTEEAMACGTPVVAYAQTGMEEMIDHMHNGYLATPFDISDFIKGIVLCLSNPQFGKVARETIVGSFSDKKMADSYIVYYKKCISQHI